MPDVAEALGVRPPVKPWVWGCPASEGWAVMASVVVAVCVRVGRLSVGEEQVRGICVGALGDPNEPTRSNPPTCSAWNETFFA